jgi:hybrid cluster-associated redox disulfide protein
MNKMSDGIPPDITLSDLMRSYPSAISVLLRYKMDCVGCNMAAFDTLAEAAANYGLNLHQLLDEIGRAQKVIENRL